MIRAATNMKTAKRIIDQNKEGLGARNGCQLHMLHILSCCYMLHILSCCYKTTKCGKMAVVSTCEA